MKKNDLMKYDEFVNESKKLNEGLDDNLRSEILDILNKVSSGEGIDKRSMEAHSDGELMAMIILPVIQSVSLDMNDRKGFVKAMKKGL